MTLAGGGNNSIITDGKDCLGGHLHGGGAAISKVVLETLVRTPESGVSWSVRTGVLSCWAIGEVKVVIEMVVDE